ncbi:hypothetical protein VFPFJ_10682 [Purpureocillium lilacinum]|uniref:Uncharacterized protein n=1 Tax=Purpureocillium lilacinum TaxID=33203 RepID=A0A179GEH7_PURLI|nr:hypothetical protein VFPFJ_10682 [Purpureocillium lilacinum]OAQ75918.1 hypothetical protein VFPFJ_10682 [Purpureocillium lilacinum]
MHSLALRDRLFAPSWSISSLPQWHQSAEAASAGSTSKVRVTSRRVTAQGNVVAVPKGPQSKHRWWTTCYKAAEQRKQVQDTQIGGSNLELHGNAAGQSQARISAPEPRHETAIAPMADCLPSSCRARSRCGDGASLMGGSWSPAQLVTSRHFSEVSDGSALFHCVGANGTATGGRCSLARPLTTPPADATTSQAQSRAWRTPAWPAGSSAGSWLDPHLNAKAAVPAALAPRPTDRQTPRLALGLASSTRPPVDLTRETLNQHSSPSSISRPTSRNTSPLLLVFVVGLSLHLPGLDSRPLRTVIAVHHAAAAAAAIVRPRSTTHSSRRFPLDASAQLKPAPHHTVPQTPPRHAPPRLLPRHAHHRHRGSGLAVLQSGPPDRARGPSSRAAPRPRRSRRHGRRSTAASTAAAAAAARAAAGRPGPAPAARPVTGRARRHPGRPRRLAASTDGPGLPLPPPEPVPRPGRAQQPAATRR